MQKNPIVIIKSCFILILIFFSAGCLALGAGQAIYSTGKAGMGFVESLKPLGYEEEKAIGGSVAIQVFKRFGGRYKDPELQRYVSLIGRSLAEVSDRPDIDYYFAIVNSREPNAFAAPGGYVFVSVGLLRMLENEAQLAGVLGHEIAHVTNKHALKTIEKSKKLSSLGTLSIAMLGSDPELFDKVIDQAIDAIFKYGLDKDMEFEADRLGVEYAHRLGYHPEGLPNFLEKLQKRHELHSSGEKSAILTTHPEPKDRLAKLRENFKEFDSGKNAPVFTAEFKKITEGKI